MLTIEGVLRLRGSEMDLYSPRFYKDSESPVDHLIDTLKGGGVLLMGQEVRNYSPTVVTLDGDAVLHHLDELELTYINKTFLLKKKNDASWITPEEWFVKHPPIPPENGWLTESTKCNMWNLRNRYLCERDKTAPTYFSVDRDPENWVILENQNSDDLLLAQIKDRYVSNCCIFFVNGLCCFSVVEPNIEYGFQIRLRDGAKYLKNQKDRSRGIVGMDFSKQCKVSFFSTKYFDGDLPKMIVDSGIDPMNSSFLLVLDGRLYLPNEFSVFTDHQLQTKADLNLPEYQLDRKCCENAFSEKMGERAVSRTLISETMNLKTAENSFLIVLNKPGLEVIHHAPHSIPNSSQFLSDKMNPAASNRVMFNGSCKGLLFDQSTRSIHDYLREEESMTFYDDECQVVEGKLPNPRKWNIALCYLNPATLLEIWGNCNNDMSASASMHDRSDVRGSAFLLRPKYTMLDFIFEG